MRRRIKRAKIKFISLVPRGANRLPTIFKEDGAFEVSLLAKGMDEQGELTAVVYAPELRDSQGDVASAAVIKDMLYDAAKNGVAIDMRHDGKAIPKDQAYVAESFLVQKGDPRFEGLTDYDGKVVDPTGAWGVVLKIDDPALRKLYREGAWEGVSMGGKAELEIEKQDPEDLADAIAARLAKRLNPEEEYTMTPEEIQTLVVKSMREENERVAKEAADAAAAAAAAAPVLPVFKGDPTNVEDVKAHREALRKHSLTEKLSKATSAEEVDAILKDLAAPAGQPPKAAPSNQGAPAGTINKGDDTGFDGVTLSKEDQEAAAAGSKMAAWING